MPFKNPGKYFMPCLESIAQQTHENWQLIGVDDNSSDGSDKVFQSFVNKDPRFEYYPNKGKGIVDALLLGEQYIKGELVGRMDADDLMPPHKLEALHRISGAGKIAVGKVQYFSDDWLVGPGFRKYEAWINQHLSQRTFDSEMFKECLLPSTAWLMTRKTFQEIGGFHCQVLPEDYDLFFRTLEHKLPYEVVNETVHFWRDHPNRTSRKDERYFPKSYFSIKWKYFKKLKYQNGKKIVLWGAGNKGKALAKILQEDAIEFSWLSNNPHKIGHDIFGRIIQDISTFAWENSQTIVAVSSPHDQSEIQTFMQNMRREEGKDWWFFC